MLFEPIAGMKTSGIRGLVRKNVLQNVLFYKI